MIEGVLVLYIGYSFVSLILFEMMCDVLDVLVEFQILNGVLFELQWKESVNVQGVNGCEWLLGNFVDILVLIECVLLVIIIEYYVSS